MKCKVCKGLGRVSAEASYFDILGADEPCRACKGAGEFEIAIAAARRTDCRFCNGTGVVEERNPFTFLPGTREMCPACKGVGMVERPKVGTGEGGVNEVSTPETPRLGKYGYDIAVSFAGEDREIVEKYRDVLTSKGLKVFYDKDEEVGLWGANLYDKLDEVYRKRALFCVIFISRHYAQKVWTSHERQSAQARALEENREYVLPVRLDDTEIPGIRPTIGYVDFRKISIDKLADMTIEKVNRLKDRRSSANTA